MQTELSYKNWYETIAHKLSGNGIWLRGEELNTLSATEFEQRTFRILFTRLSTYRDTSDSFTHKLLYQIAKNTEKVFPDIAYLPPAADTKYFDNSQVPWILPVKTKFHPSKFDVIGISNSIVQEIINIPVMLTKSGIPLLKSIRIHDKNIPIVILGGANSVNCSALCNEDPLVDGIFIGEDTESIRQILETCRDGKHNKISKTEILHQLEDIEGFFQPDTLRKNDKKIIKKLSLNTEQLIDAPVLYSEEASNGLLRISEGCPYFCSFCSESWNRKPYLEEPAEKLTKDALRLKANCGLSNIELYSFNFNIHSELYKILWNLSEMYTNTGLKSQRFDHISKNPELLKILQVVGKSSITCGLEGISDRIRKYLHKNLNDTTLFKSLDYLVKSHIRELKIFLIATGKETDEDFHQFENLLQILSSSLKGLKHRPRIIFSTTPLVRFPLTPLEFEDAPPVKIIKQILEKISLLVKNNGFESRAAADFNEYYISQILVRSNSPEVFKALCNIISKTGFVYYSSIPDKFVKLFNEEIKTVFSQNELLAGHNSNSRKEKIWNLFSTGVSEKYLLDTYKECQSFQEKNPCYATKKCNACDACPDTAFIKKITHAEQIKSYSAEELHRKIIERKKDQAIIHFTFERGNALSGIPGEMAGIALARALMLAESDLTPSYLGYVTSYLDPENKGVWITGDDVLTLSWESQAEKKILQKITDTNFLNKVNEYLTPEWGILKGSIQEISVNCTIKINKNLSANLQEYLLHNHLKHTQRKNPEGGYIYDFTKDSLKKELIKKLETKADETILVTGKKFNYPAFAKKCLSQFNTFNTTCRSFLDIL